MVPSIPKKITINIAAVPISGSKKISKTGKIVRNRGVKSFEKYISL